jgi:tripartite-type tricarboxylate transporter receptor subunit TctC
VFARAGTPGALRNRLNHEIIQVPNQADVKKRFLNAGVETAGSYPDEALAAIKSEMAIMGKVLKGIIRIE